LGTSGYAEGLIDGRVEHWMRVKVVELVGMEIRELVENVVTLEDGTDKLKELVAEAVVEVDTVWDEGDEDWAPERLLDAVEEADADAERVVV
jgi:hypothetical protein